MLSATLKRTANPVVIFLMIFAILNSHLALAQTGDPIIMNQTDPGRTISSESARARGAASGQGSYLGPQTPAQEQGKSVYVHGVQGSGTRPFTGAPAWGGQQSAYYSLYGTYPPFGANLFQGFFAGTYYDGMNENYIVMPGDRILVHIWGAYAFSDTLMVDQHGNIFIPEVGPVPVLGVKHANLQSRIKARLAETFRTNVNVYVTLLTSQPVAVYVTGFVERPGRYAGGPSDSVLFFLDRAGGILPDRGSYRDIKVQRNNKTVAQVDLYDFILNGGLPIASLRDGDVIVVGPKGSSVTADGMIPQYASYESIGDVFKGQELTRFAAPLPSVSHVSVTGTRNSRPFHIYLGIKDFADFDLAANDRVEFLADRPGETIMVSVSGSVLGSTRYPVKRHTSLRTLLAHIPVDQDLSNLNGIYIKRKSVVEQQRKALSDALYRLEKSVLTGTSATTENASIRVKEAELVQNFVERAKHLEPDGVVVVTRSGVVADIFLEDGDEVIIPQRSDIVQVSGEVMIPKAIVYTSGKSAKSYVMSAGGFTDRADEGNILVVHPNGEIAQAKNTRILPGDLLLVMPEYDSKGFSIFKDIVQILYQIAIATKVVIDI